jgi:hypothetical protein
VNTTSRDRRDDNALRSDGSTDPKEEREFELIASLLRSLPDPEPESDLTMRVMQKVREIEARPRLLPAPLRRLSGPRAALLAAGIACAAVGIRLQATRTSSSLPPFDVEATSPVAVRSTLPVRAASNAAQMNRFAYADPRAAALFSGSPSDTSLQVFPIAAGRATSILDRRLDAQLNELQLDPQAFFRRLERVQERDRFVQRLAERAAQRGDAAQVALNVRAVSHPLAPPMVDQLLHASLLRRGPDR